LRGSAIAVWAPKGSAAGVADLEVGGGEPGGTVVGLEVGGGEPRGTVLKPKLFYLFIYLYLILACNRRVMAEATNYGTLSGARVLCLSPAGICPRAVFHVRVVVPFLLFGPFLLSSFGPGALFARRPPRRVVLPFLHPSPPIFSLFPAFISSSIQAMTKEIEIKQQKK
jgi:hypothetical protein